MELADKFERGVNGCFSICALQRSCILVFSLYVIINRVRSVSSRPSEFVLPRKPGSTSLHENTSPFIAFLELRNSQSLTLIGS